MANLYQAKIREIGNQKMNNKTFSNGIFTSVGEYSNSDVELTVEFPPIYLGQPF